MDAIQKVFMELPVAVVAVNLQTMRVHSVNNSCKKLFAGSIAIDGTFAAVHPDDQTFAKDVEEWLKQMAQNREQKLFSFETVNEKLFYGVPSITPLGAVDVAFIRPFSGLYVGDTPLLYMYARQLPHAVKTILHTRERLSSFLIFFRDFEGKFIFVNKEFEKLYDLKLEKVYGRKPEELPLPELFLEHLKRIEEAFSNGVDSFSEELVVDVPSDKKHCFFSESYGGHFDSGVFQGICTVFKSMDWENNRLNLFKREEELLQVAMESMQSLLYAKEEVALLVSEMLRRIGHAARVDNIDIWRNHESAHEGLLATQLYSWVRQEYKDISLAFGSTISYEKEFPHWKDLLFAGQSINSNSGMISLLEQELLEQQGFKSVLMVPIFNESGFWGLIRFGTRLNVHMWTAGEEAILRTVGVFISAITLQRHMQEALDQSESRFHDVLKAAGEVVWEINAQGYFSYVSERIEALIGYKVDEVKGKRWEDFALDESEASLTGEMFQTSILQGSFRTIEHQIKTKNGNILWLLSSGSFFTGTEGIAGIRGTSLDITAIKATEKKLSVAMARLEETNKSLHEAVKEAELLAMKADSANKAKTDFIANMSHELRTPLNAIIGMTYLAQKTSLSPNQLNYLKKINSSGVALLAIINDILDFSKLESGTIALTTIPFSIDDVLANMALFFSEDVEKKNLDCTFFVMADVPRYLVGDALRLRQILNNVVGNAIKFTESGGTFIRCSLEDQKNDEVFLRFTVQDTGIGVDDAQLDSLFSAFNQGDSSTTRKFGGMGLGLVITKSLVESLGGSILVESTLGTGTAVSIILPFSLQEGVHERLLRVKNEGLHVLLLSKEGIYQTTLCQMLEDLGCATVAFSNAAQAFARISKSDDSGAPFDIVLFDEEFISKDSVNNISHLRENMTLRSIPQVVAMVGTHYVGQKSESGTATPDAVLLKPLVTLHLLDVLQGLPDESNLQPFENVETDTLYFSGVRVLLVDDNEINQEIGIGLLREVGIEAYVAATGKEAIRVLEEHEDNFFSLIFMDLQMPEMDGFEATKYIRQNERFAHFPIIAMTAYATEEEQKHCFEVGMDEHMVKPLNVHKLHQTLEKWIAPSAKGAKQAEELSEVVGELEKAGFDVEILLGAEHNDFGKACSLIDIFLQEHAQISTTLAEFINGGFVESAGHLVALLRKDIETLGGDTACVAFVGMEKALTEHNMQAMKESLPEFVQFFSDIINSLQRIIDCNTKQLTSAGESDVSEELVKKLQTLIKLLEDDDAASCDLFKEIEEGLKQINHTATIEASKALVVFDFSTALSYLVPMGKVL